MSQNTSVVPWPKFLGTRMSPYLDFKGTLKKSGEWGLLALYEHEEILKKFSLTPLVRF